MSLLSNSAYNLIFTYTINVLTQVIVTFRSAPIYSRISCHQSASTTCTHKIVDCGNAFALGQNFEARMGTPTRQNINSTWLFDEVTEEFSGDTLPSDNHRCHLAL